MNAPRVLKRLAPLACIAAVMAIEKGGLAAETTRPPVAAATAVPSVCLAQYNQN